MKSDSANTHCSCGNVNYAISGVPLLRVFCHCTICQALNQAPYADITLFRAKDVIMPKKDCLKYKAQKFPPILQRGKCTSCNKIAIEYLQLFPIPKTIIVPSQNIVDKTLVPEPALHIFYDTRVNDIKDDLPKYSGYLKSQLAFGRKLVGSLFHLSPNT